MFSSKKQTSNINCPALLDGASHIVSSTNYTLLQASWDEFMHILRTDSSFDEDEEKRNLYGSAAYPWYALKKIQKLKGDITNFSIFELHLLKALQDGYLIYDEIMHVLIEHHDDEKEARLLFETHPKLHQALPKEYDNTKQVIEVLIEVVRMYRWELEEFSKAHGAALGDAIEVIIRDKKNL